MADARSVILESFHLARAVPVMHLIEQFLNPGKKDADAKQVDEKDNPATKPLLTREEALSRLQCRIENGLAPDDHAGCKDYLQKLSRKVPSSCTNSEKLILGLAYEYGLGDIPKQPAKALETFKSAVDETDDNNGYALTFVIQSRLNSTQFQYSGQLEKAKPLGLTLARHGIACYNQHSFLLSGEDKNGHRYAKGFYEQAQRSFKAAASRGHYLGSHNLGSMYAIHKDKTKRPEGEKYLKAAIAQGCSDSIAAYAQYYIAEPAIRREWLTMAQKHGSDYAARQIKADNMSTIARDAFEQAERYVYHKSSSLNQLVDAAAYFRLASILGDKEQAKLLFDEMKEHYLAILHSRQPLYNRIKYHYALAFNDESDLHYLLKHKPRLFIRLWEKDYKNPLHPKMKEQAIACVLQIDPTKLSPEANGLLAIALAQCSEKDLKDKADKFAAEKAAQVELQKKVAAMDAKSAAALPTLSMVQQIGAQGAAALDATRNDVESRAGKLKISIVSSRR